ncbi:hypothetical protein Tco_1517259 [Tanacetum coccineum]
MDNDSGQEADHDMGYDSSDVAFIEWLGSKNFNYKTMDHYTMKALWIYWIKRDDEVELTDEESSNNDDEIAKVFRIDTNIFDYETPLCLAFNEFNYLLKMRNHGLTLEFRPNPHQLNILSSLSIIRLDVQNGQHVVGRIMDTTSDGLAAIQAQLNNLGREIKKVNENVYAAQVGCEQCKGLYYTKDFPLKEEGKTLEEAYYTQFGRPFQGRGYRETALGESAKRHEENSNLIKKIQATTDAAIRNQGASIKTLENTIGQQLSRCEEENYGPKLRKLMELHYIINTIHERMEGASVSVMPLLTYLNLGLGELAHTKLTVELADRTVKYPKGIAENVLV